MQENLLKIDLQLFAEEEDTEEEKKDNSQEETPEANSQEGSGLPQTQEELDALIARRVEREKKKSTKKEEPQDEEGSKTTSEEGAHELKNAQRELLLARAQLEAFHNGVKSEVVEDAVYLALREAEKKGVASEESIKEALKDVLKRHPEWKLEAGQEGGGFKVGATGGKGKLPSETAIAEIFGNK